MKISIVTAVYNREGTIRTAIESVHRQTYGSIEHVIQDGGSSDGTIKAIRDAAYGSINLESAPDHGIYDAINRGIMRATGDIIGLMHSDDMFAQPLVLEKVATAFAKSAVDGVYGDLQYVASDDLTRVIRHWKAGEYRPSLIKMGWMPPHPTLFLRREVVDRFGLYDTSFRIAADYDAMLRYLVKGQIKLAYIPEVLVKMRLGGESNRSLAQIILKSREDLRALRNNGVGGLGTLAAKNLRKISQFLVKGDDSE